MYVREAHPIDSNWADKSLDVADPTTHKERRKVAKRCAKELGLDLPMAVDGLDDAVAMAYNAWPERLYVIEPGGTIHYKGGLGPFGFKPREAGAALEVLLAKMKVEKALEAAEGEGE